MCTLYHKKKKIAVFPFTECLKILSCKYNHLSVWKATVKGTELNHSKLYIFWNRYFFMDMCNWRKKQTQYAHSLQFALHINFPESLSSCFQYHVSILIRKYAKKKKPACTPIIIPFLTLRFYINKCTSSVKSVYCWAKSNIVFTVFVPTH
jgi:hypothetical protein